MSFIYDAILESNQLEDEARVISKKNPPSLKRRQLIKDEELDECSNNKMKEDEMPLDESTLTEEKMVDIEQYLEPENYVESLKESCESLPDRAQKGRHGSPEYDANENRRKRTARYRQLANIDEDFEITENNINDWALTRACTFENCPKDKMKAELLKQPYTGLEKYEED